MATFLPFDGARRCSSTPCPAERPKPGEKKKGHRWGGAAIIDHPNVTLSGKHIIPFADSVLRTETKVLEEWSCFSTRSEWVAFSSPVTVSRHAVNHAGVTSDVRASARFHLGCSVFNSDLLQFVITLSEQMLGFY